MFVPPSYALPEDLTPLNVLRAMEKKYIGAFVATLSPPAALRDTSCAAVNAKDLICDYWTESGPLRANGLRIKFASDPQGQVSSITVTPISRWFGTYVFDL